MIFTKSTTFSDPLDEEIYVFRLMINLTEHLRRSSNPACSFQYNDIEVHINKYTTLNRIGIQVYTDDQWFEPIESGDAISLGNMNYWFEDRCSIVFDKKSPRYSQYSIIFDAYEIDNYESDTQLLDSYLDGGVNNIPEEFYFQQTLIRDIYMPKYEDIDRILDALKTESTIPDSIVFEKIPVFTTDEYYELYTQVLKNIGVIDETK